MDFKCLKITLISIAMTVVVLGSTRHIYSKSHTIPEYEVKSVFICKFLDFIKWPNDTEFNEYMTLYVVGNNPFGTSMDKAVDNIAETKKLKVKYVKSLQNPVDNCVVFISSSEERRLLKILKTLNGANILTIGDTKGFAQQGVIINLFIQKDRIRFEINVNAAERANLTISSKLLRLSKIVHDEPMR